MASPAAAGLLQRSMFNQEIEGEFIQVNLATIGEEDFNPETFELEDGSRSWKGFEDEENGNTWPDVKFPPSKVVHSYFDS